MKYRTKLFYAFSSLALISNLLALFISYGEMRSIVYGMIKGNIFSIVTTTSTLLNGDVIETFKSPGSMDTKAYQDIKQKLRIIRNFNRQFSTYVQYIFLVIKSPENPKQLVILMDPDEQVDGTQFGYPFDDKDLIINHLTEPYVPLKFSTDQWGTYLSGYAPVFNSQGTWVASLGVDVNTAVFHAYHKVLLKNGAIALLISLIIAILLARILSHLVTTSLRHVCQIVDKIGHGDLSSRITLASKDEFYDLSQSINDMAKGLQERERLKLGFARYVSQFVLEKILQSEKPTKLLEGERKKVTVLFSDIRNFTALSEKLPPEQVVGILNEYFEKMIEAIFKHNGTLDKFIGDGIMVEFGAPLEDENQEKHALETAVYMQMELKKLNEKWKIEGKPTLEAGIGIHSGPAVVGNIGSEKRMEYTAIGDTVNIASRLEQMTKKLNKAIIISEPVYQVIKDAFKVEPLGRSKLPGRTQEIEIYSVFYE